MLSLIGFQAIQTTSLPATYASNGRHHIGVPQHSWSFRLGITAALLLSLTGLMAASAVAAQPSRAAQRAASAQQMLERKYNAAAAKYNAAAVMILGGRPGTTYSGIVHDMAAALRESDGLRLVTVDAPGGPASLRDLMLLRGIDLALIPANVLDDADAMAALGPGLSQRLTYITALYGEEVHVLAGAGIESIKDLSGRKVAVPVNDGNVEFTAVDLLRRLHIEAEVIKVAAADAIDDVRSGGLAALVLVGGKPLRLIATLPKDGSLHLLALPATQGLGNGYSPASFGADDYPALIAPRQTIDTLSVSVVVANKTADGEDSSRRIARFVPAFFGSLSELSSPRWHPKWGEVNLAATLSKWPRDPAAEEWLRTALQQQSASIQRDFEEFLRVSTPAGSPVPSPAERKQMFEDYLRWTRSPATSSH